MKSVIEVCLLALAITHIATAQDTTKPVLRPGIHVEMPTANHAVKMRAADEENATVVTVTLEGKLFLGVQPIDLVTLDKINATTVYVKADSRVPYQKIVEVLDALEGRPVVLLTQPILIRQSDNIVPPYGLPVVVGSR